MFFSLSLTRLLRTQRPVACLRRRCSLVLLAVHTAIVYSFGSMVHRLHHSHFQCLWSLAPSQSSVGAVTGRLRRVATKAVSRQRKVMTRRYFQRLNSPRSPRRRMCVLHVPFLSSLLLRRGIATYHRNTGRNSSMRGCVILKDRPLQRLERGMALGFGQHATRLWWEEVTCCSTRRRLRVEM